MPIHERHVTERSRTYSGEEEAEGLVSWLNERPLTEAQARLFSILRIFRELSDAWKVERGADSAGNEYLRTSREVSDKWVKHRDELGKLLRSYTYYPLFYPMGSYIEMRWLPVSKKPGEDRHRLPAEYDDRSAVLDLAAIADAGLLDRLRECSCGRWIWARFKHQRFCSARCREKHFRSSDEWKKHRRYKAREYYWLHRNKNTK